MKVTLPHLRELKIAGTPIVMVTTYDLPSARIVDSAEYAKQGRKGRKPARRRSDGEVTADRDWRMTVPAIYHRTR